MGAQRYGVGPLEPRSNPTFKLDNLKQWRRDYPIVSCGARRSPMEKRSMQLPSFFRRMSAQV